MMPDDISLRQKNAELLTAMFEGAEQIEALPVALICVVRGGWRTLIASDFPTSLLPTREEWEDAYPGNPVAIAVKLKPRQNLS